MPGQPIRLSRWSEQRRWTWAQEWWIRRRRKRQSWRLRKWQLSCRQWRACCMRGRQEGRCQARLTGACTRYKAHSRSSSGGDGGGLQSDADSLANAVSVLNGGLPGCPRLSRVISSGHGRDRQCTSDGCSQLALGALRRVAVEDGRLEGIVLFWVARTRSASLRSCGLPCSDRDSRCTGTSRYRCRRKWMIRHSGWCRCCE